MHKNTKLKGQESYKKPIPYRKLKPSIKVKSFDPSKLLTNKASVFQALWECLLDNDVESFKEILSAHLEAVNKINLAQKSKISKRTIHRMLSPEGNPTLKNISSILHALHE